MDRDLLTIFRNRKTFDRFFYLIPEHAVSWETWNILKGYERYYNTNPGIEDIELLDFQGNFRFWNSGKFNKEKLSQYDSIFTELKSHMLTKGKAEEVMSMFIELDYASKIQDASLNIITKNGKNDINDIEKYIADYQHEAAKFEKEDTALVTTDIHKLLDATVGGSGYNWRIHNLNESLGPIRRGNFVVVGARPDSGKTTFLLNEATYIASQLDEDQCILWLNNEEMGEKIGRRIIESGAGVTTSDLRDDPLGSVEKFKKMVGPLSKIKVIYQSVINTREVEHWCKKYKPSVLVFDQLWKIVGFEKDAANDTQRQTLLFSWARSLASQWGPVIVVHQLGSAAEGEKFPPMSALYGSQTGIQGEADAIILIGRSSDPRENDVRFFSLPKNKMGDGVHVKPGMRNARFVLKIKPDIARYEDVGSYVVS